MPIKFTCSYVCIRYVCICMYVEVCTYVCTYVHGIIAIRMVHIAISLTQLLVILIINKYPITHYTQQN